MDVVARFGVAAALALATLPVAGMARAQDATQPSLPTIDVTTRIRTVAPGRSSSQSGPTRTEPGQIGGAAAAGIGIVGASNTVITAREIEASPAQNLPDILAQQAGIQLQRQAGGVSGARSAVDLRGFGATAHSNVLILVNGRRYQDFDLQGFDFSAIPLNSIERVEITRGNSGTVVYGDGGIGGVINIVTKSTTAKPFTARVEGAYGGYNYGEGRVSMSGSSGPWSGSLSGNVIGEDGYRKNSVVRQQNVVAGLNYATPSFQAYVNVLADKQHQGLPGALFNRSAAFPFLLSTPRETTTPFDFGEKQGVNVIGGVVLPLGPGANLTLDGGVRHKFQQGQFFNYFPAPAFVFDPLGAVPATHVDTTMVTSSFTPRLEALHQSFGVPNRLVAGIDVYDTQYQSDRRVSPSSPTIHHYDIGQTTVAVYAMNKSTFMPNLDVSYGGRVQSNRILARDDYNAAVDPNAGFYGTNPQAPPLSSSEVQYAAHLGFEYRINPAIAFFGRVARAFRLPNADERVAAGNAFGLTAPANFAMKTQTSNDIEGGVRFKGSRFEFETSVYDMYLTNEVHFIAALFQNINLDPTRRTGWEARAAWQATPDVRLHGGVAYVRAVFREGPFAGNALPLVSPWTGNASLTWDIFKKALVLDVTARVWSERRMDNDQPNRQPLIPGNATVDIKIGGTHERYFWSAAVLDAFNNGGYFDYAFASAGFPAGPFGPAVPPTIGVYSAYPLAGRTFLLRAGAIH